MPKYTDAGSGISISSDTDLTDAEIEEAFLHAGAPPPQGDMPPPPGEGSQTRTRSSVQSTEGQTTPSSPTPFTPPEKGAGLTPTIVRGGMTALGAGAGGLLTAPIPGAMPAGIALGGAIGAGAGDLWAQNIEMSAGAREEFNPMRNLIETAIGGLGAEVGVDSKNIFNAAAQVAGFGALSDTAVAVSEGQPIPGKGQLAISALTGAVLGGVSHYVSKTKELHEILSDKDAVETADALLSGKRVRVPGTNNIEDMRQSILRVKQPTRASRASLQKAKDVLSSLSGDVGEAAAAVKGKDPGVLPRLGGMFEPNKFELERIQRKSGIPVFDDYLKIRPLEDAYHRGLAKDGAELHKIFKGMGKSQQIQMLRAVATGEAGSLPPDRVKKLGEVFDRALSSFDLNRQDFFRMATEPKTLPKRLRGLAEYVAAGDVSPGEPNALLAASRLLRASNFRETLGPTWADMVDKYSKMAVPKNVREPMMQYLNAVRGRPDKTAVFLTHAMNEVLSTLDPVMAKMGRKGIRGDARDVVSAVMSSSYSGLLGFRLGPVVRNTFQTVQTAGPVMGGRWLVSGYKDLATSAGRARAAAAGMRSQVLELAEVEDMAKSALGRKFQTFTKASLKPFGAVEDVNRSAVYLGMFNKTMDAAKQALSGGSKVREMFMGARGISGKLGKFLDISDIDRYTPGERDAISALFTGGKIEEAADLAARFMVDNTQFMYRASERPQVLQSMGGRVLGGLGIWPLSYGSYLRRNFVPFTSHGPGWKKGRDFARFVLANAAIAGGMATLGHELGDEDAGHDALSWTFLEPTFFTGGPTLELAISAGKAGRELATGTKGHAVSEFRKNATGFIPGYRAVEEAFKARDEQSPVQAAGRLLGLKRGSK